MGKGLYAGVALLPFYPLLSVRSTQILSHPLMPLSPVTVSSIDIYLFKTLYVRDVEKLSLTFVILEKHSLT